MDTLAATGKNALQTLPGSRTGDPARMNMTSLPDEALYSRYARDRELAALELLVARWHQTAYRLARLSCHDANLAEEAVQDAFLKLSSLRAPFQDRGPGSFRAWFLGLIANSACAARRAELRALRKRAVDPRALVLRRGAAQEPQPAGEEVSAWLGRSVAALEDAWRLPLLLHFVEGMQQQEVARTLGISQQMVSRRVRQGLGLLKRRLNEAGLAAAAPLEGLAKLVTGLSAELQAPVNGCARVLARCASKTAGSVPGPVSRASTGASEDAPAETTGRWRPARDPSTFAVLGLAACGALALATAGGWWLEQDSQPSPAAHSGPGDSNAQFDPRVLDSVAGKPFPVLWNFDRKPEQPFPAARGSWDWQPGKDTQPGSIHLAPGDPPLLILPVVVPPCSLKVRVRLRELASSTGSFFGLGPTDGRSTFTSRKWLELTARSLSRPVTVRYYLVSRYLVLYLNDSKNLSSVTEYATQRPGDRIFFHGYNFEVEEIEISQPEVGEMPEDLKRLLADGPRATLQAQAKALPPGGTQPPVEPPWIPGASLRVGGGAPTKTAP